MNRRRFLHTAVALGVAREVSSAPSVSAFGMAAFSYAGRLNQQRELRDPLAFLKFCRERGAGGVQIGIPRRDAADYRELRRYLEESGAWLEGQVRLPRDAADGERFEAEVRSARDAGATVVRTVMLSGRRYETFPTAAEYREFQRTSARSVQLAQPIVARLRMRLAVENHKDYRTDEQLDLLRRIGSEWVGVTVDTGNNLALLEEPLATVEALAPYAFTVHLKDMAVEECAEGFLLSEVPFGRGFLDLPRIVATLQKHRPEIRFNVEMATRDPLRVPCLTERYWATMNGVPAPALARMLSLVRERKEGRPLPRVTEIPLDRRLELEDANARECQAYTRNLRESKDAG